MHGQQNINFDISLFRQAKPTRIYMRTYGNAVITLSGVCSVIPAHFDARQTAFL